MTTNELIACLQKEDPEGNLEVVVGGDPIHFLQKLPGYYDGSYAVLIRDPANKPFYDIVGIRHTRSGNKVKIHTIDTGDILCDNPEAVVELDPSLGFQIKEMAARIEAMRVEYRELDAQIKKGSDSSD